MPSPFDPLSFRCGAVAKNRLALAPLTNQQSHPDGTLGEDELRFLARRARGGFGLVETCAAHVSPEGQAFEGQLGIHSDAHLPGLTRLASVLAAHGALGVVQLHHGGARSPSALIGQQPLGASALPEPPPGMESPRAASSADVERLADDFVQAAQRAYRAGFQGVELHGAHAYLLGQFLSSATNRRSDAWGGSLENRARLLRTIARRVRISVPASFLLGVRLSPEDFGTTRGLDLDESIQVARWLADDGVDSGAPLAVGLPAPHLEAPLRAPGAALPSRAAQRRAAGRGGERLEPGGRRHPALAGRGPRRRRQGCHPGFRTGRRTSRRRTSTPSGDRSRPGSWSRATSDRPSSTT